MPRLSVLDVVIVLAIIALLVLAARQDFPRFGMGEAPRDPAPAVESRG